MKTPKTPTMLEVVASARVSSSVVVFECDVIKTQNPAVKLAERIRSFNVRQSTRFLLSSFEPVRNVRFPMSMDHLWPPLSLAVCHCADRVNESGSWLYRPF